MGNELVSGQCMWSWATNEVFVCGNKREEVRKEAVMSSWTSETREEERRGGGRVDLKCLSVSGGCVMIQRGASDLF